MGKTYRFKKKIGTGRHCFVKDGQRFSIGPGDIYEGQPEDLGSQFKNYELLAASTRKKPLAAWEVATEKCVDRLKIGNIWLDATFRPGIGSIEHIPADVKGLNRVKVIKEDKSEDGEMGRIMLMRHEAWRDWKYQCKIDPKSMKSLKEPEEPWLSKIAEAEARMKILEMELKEIGIRLELAEQSEQKQENNRAEKLKFHGFAQHRNHRYFEVDGRLVIYQEGKPYFKDDNTSVLEYLDTCKKVRTEKDEKAKAARANRRKEQREQQETV